MNQRDRAKPIWGVTLLIAVLLGIWPGIALTQSPHLIFLGVLGGWFAFPLTLFNLIKGATPAALSDQIYQQQLLAACGYPLAMLGYSACAYWAMRSTGSRQHVFLLMLVAASVSTLASIPAAIIARSINHYADIITDNPASFAIVYVFILFQLMISAMFGWIIGTRRLIEMFARQERKPLHEPLPPTSVIITGEKPTGGATK